MQHRNISRWRKPYAYLGWQSTPPLSCTTCGERMQGHWEESVNKRSCSRANLALILVLVSGLSILDDLY